MVCLDNRIGVKGCGAVTDPAPQLYVNDLPGVSVELMDSLTNAEQETFLDIWRNIALRALKKFEILVRAQFCKCYNISDKTVVPCLVCENVELFDVCLWYLHGTELMIEVTSSDQMSRFTTVGLEKAETLKTEFFTEASAALADAVSSINPQESDCQNADCLEVAAHITFVQQTP
jgi:hypothetical protein